MDVQQNSTPEASVESDPRLFNEINLLRLEGFYFCLDPKEAGRRGAERYDFFETLKDAEKNSIERPVVILANSRYGYPSPLAYKVLQGILKKLSDYGHPVPNTVHFSQRELARLVGRKTFGGRDQKELHQAVKQLQATEVSCFFHDKETKQWGNLDFSILTATAFSGKRNGITECYVKVDDHIVRSLNSRYTVCLNYNVMQQLEPIGMALYKHLFFKFSNRYSLTKKKNLPYTKDYGAICTDWLGGLKVLGYKSKIVNEQLGTHINALQSLGFIKSGVVAKNTPKTGFNIHFLPGPQFYADYAQFYARQFQYELQFQKTVEIRQSEEPLSLVSYLGSE